MPSRATLEKPSSTRCQQSGIRRGEQRGNVGALAEELDDVTHSVFLGERFQLGSETLIAPRVRSTALRGRLIESDTAAWSSAETPP
jgi:hypothetical protein